MRNAGRVLFLLVLLAARGLTQSSPGISRGDLLKKAQSGDANAQFELGRAYEDGKGFPQDDGLAVEWLRKAAEQGNAKAQSRLGTMYSVGRGVARDKEAAFRWYKKAAKQGLPEGMYNVAISYFNGEGVSADLDLSYAWMRAAQTQGDAEAGDALKHITDEMLGNTEAGQFKLGEMYERGEDLPKDFAGAAKIYLEIAQKPYREWRYAPVAQFKMCQFYATGSGVPLNLAEAKSWCKKATASGSVNQSALLVLGKIAEQEKNPAEAERWYEKAILARDGRGFLPLARLKMQDGPQGERDAYYWLYLAEQFNVQGADTELQLVAARLSASDVSEQEKKAYKWMQKFYPTKAKTMKQP